MFTDKQLKHKEVTETTVTISVSTYLLRESSLLPFPEMMTVEYLLRKKGYALLP